MSTKSIAPEVLRALAPFVRAQPLLSGPEIARVRQASHVVPTLRRYRIWARKQKVPAHVGKKQLSKGACAAD